MSFIQRSSPCPSPDPTDPSFNARPPSYQPAEYPELVNFRRLSQPPPDPRQSYPTGEMSYDRSGPRDPVPDLAPFSATQKDRGGNVPERYESILLAEDEAKVTETPETRVPNASLFTLAKEDHTLGNLLRDRLLRDPACATEFAAYQVPHPLFPDVLVRVQTDGSITPREAVIKAARGLIEELEGVRGEFQKEWELVKIRRRTEEAERAAQEGLTASGGMDGVQATDGVYGSVDAYGVGGQQQGQSGGYGGGGQPNGNYGYQGYAGQGQADGYQYGGYGGQQNGGY